MHQVGLPYHWGQRGLTTGDAANDLAHMALDPNVHIQEVEGASRATSGPGAGRAAGGCATSSADARRRVVSGSRRTYGDEQPRMGFFTDTTVCIGCKACEVACKEWNLVPADGYDWTGQSYDNTGELGANTWRHVAFVEQDKPLRLDGETSRPRTRSPSRCAG